MNSILASLITIIKLFVVLIVLVTIGLGTFIYGYSRGYNEGSLETQNQILQTLKNNDLEVSSQVVELEPEVITKTVYITPKPYAKPTWSGPELWDEVNKRRKELGVNAMANQAELCTVASIRLNELLELGKLDAHEGFSNLTERREDLKWIFEKYDVSEFLVSGAQSAAGAVSLWENTLGHKKLLTGGEYVWGCIYAQNGIGVAITAY